MAHMLWKLRQHFFVSFYLLLALDGLIFVFSRNMAQRYTAEEVCEAIMNDDDFGELESADSLDESFTDFTSSCSDVDSNPDNNYCGQTIAIETRTPSPAWGRPQKRAGFNSRVRTREGRSRGRGTPTRGASSNLSPNKKLASAVSDDEINSPKDPSSDPKVDEPLSGIWKDNPPTMKDFSFNKQIGLKIDVPENASPIFFFKVAFDWQISGCSSKENKTDQS